VLVNFRAAVAEEQHVVGRRGGGGSGVHGKSIVGVKEAVLVSYYEPGWGERTLSAKIWPSRFNRYSSLIFLNVEGGL
jgi:hypothetical protein